jgi:hypothetical protein
MTTVIGDNGAPSLRLNSEAGDCPGGGIRITILSAGAGGDRRQRSWPMTDHIEQLEERRLLSVSIGSTSSGTIVPIGGGGTITQPAPTPVPVGVTIHAEATDSFSGVVGSLKNFVPPPVVLPVNTTPKSTPAVVGLRATIDWGDGTTPTAGTFTFDATTKQFVVRGTHTWAKAGTYTVTVSVTWGPVVPPGPGPRPLLPIALLATIKSTAIIRPDDDGGVTLSETAQKAFKATLGNFDFRAIDLVTTATIDWGDGTHSAGTIVGNFATGEYSVVGNHTYAKAGDYKVHVKVLSHLAGAPMTVPSGTVAQWTSTIHVKATA